MRIADSSRVLVNLGKGFRARPLGEGQRRVCCRGLGGRQAGEEVVYRPVGQGQRQGVVGQFQGADLRVPKLLDAAVVDADVVGGPPGAEVGTEGGQVTDEVRQGLVVGRTARWRTWRATAWT
jgi:hypothetical protein